MPKKPLILIVDDEDSFIEIMTTKLRAEGFDTAAAHDETEAMKQAEALSPDLILMDIYMPPGPTGTDAALAIKQNPKTKNIKIAFLSSLNNPWPFVDVNKDKASREMGMEDFLMKENDLDANVSKIREILKGVEVEAKAG
ncbi:MAG: response regulator [Candidatus Liptonbacteria bacterium]|nr:response regulator [Candidatus Liptonbacteria bacterium]